MDRVSSQFELHLRDQFNSLNQPTSMRTTRQQKEQQPLQIHQDECTDEEGDTVMDESMGPLDESGVTVTDSEDEEIEESVADDIAKFEDSFRNINKRYRLINRIGEGMRY
jgi:cell division control protein 7